MRRGTAQCGSRIWVKAVVKEERLRTSGQLTAQLEAAE
jgi:hypothetical protein